MECLRLLSQRRPVLGVELRRRERAMQIAQEDLRDPFQAPPLCDEIIVITIVTVRTAEGRGLIVSRRRGAVMLSRCQWVKQVGVGGSGHCERGGRGKFEDIVRVEIHTHKSTGRTGERKSRGRL